MGYYPLINPATPRPKREDVLEQALYECPTGNLATGRLSDACAGTHRADMVPKAVSLQPIVDLLVGKWSHHPERRAPFSCVQSLCLMVFSPPFSLWCFLPAPLLVPALPGHAGGCSALPNHCYGTAPLQDYTSQDPLLLWLCFSIAWPWAMRKGIERMVSIRPTLLCVFVCVCA